MKRRQFIRLVGGVAALPLVVDAQEAGRTYRIGVLVIAPHTDPRYAPLFDELRRAGFVEGQNLQVVDWEWRPELFVERAAALVKDKVDALFCGAGYPAVRACQQATMTIPIVGVLDDMVASGLVHSLARPGGNLTGVSILATELNVKRLEILHQFVPRARRIAVIADPTTNSTRDELTSAALRLGVDLVWFEATSPDEIRRSFDALAAAKAEAINVLASAILFANHRLIIERAAELQLPAIYQWPEIAEAGGLLGYGPRNVQMTEIIARQLVKLLKGAAPADLPVEHPMKFELVINLRTAKAIGLTIQSSLLQFADKVIE